MRAHILLRLYPAPWRARYQEEMEALLDQHTVTLATIFDLLWGALDARLDPAFTTEKVFCPMSRIRASLVGVLCAYAFFYLGAMGFARLTDPRAPFEEVGQAYPAIGATFHVTTLAPQFELAILLLGGAPVALDIIWRAWRERNWRTLRLFATPPVLLIICVVYLYLASNVWLSFDSQGYTIITPISQAVLTITGVLLFGSGVACVVVVSYAVARGEVRLSVLRFARWAAVALTLAMAANTAAVAWWGVQTYTQTPWLYIGTCGLNCPSIAGTGQIGFPSLVVAVVWMSLALVVAAIFTARSFTARRPEPGASVTAAPQVA